VGSHTVITDSSGVRLRESDYYPFGGERVVLNNLSDEAHKFSGKERDAESGLDYFGARYYSYRMGRFATPDWSAAPVPVPYADLGNPQSLNLYSYVQNNPITGVDPDGHFCTAMPKGDGICPIFAVALDQQLELQEGETAKGLQAQNLSAHDIAQIIKSAQANSSDAVTTAISMFNNLGQNVTASGEALRAGMKEANFSMPDALAPMVSNATSVSKSGNAVTIESAKRAEYQLGDNTIRVDKTVRFNVDVGKGTAAVTGISGLSAKKGFLWPGINEVRYTSTGQNRGTLEIKSWITKRLSCTSDGCQ
jgi:RHS repeat-associated protein